MDPSDRMARHDRKRETLGQYAECAVCRRETDIRTLRKARLDDPNGAPLTVVLCASCQIQLQGKRPTEKHHMSGKANDAFTIPIPANDHAVLTDAQQDWPRATWRNPDGSPLLVAAATFRGWLDVLQLMIDRTIGWIPELLESLDSWLRTTNGKQWWTAFETYRMGTA